MRLSARQKAELGLAKKESNDELRVEIVFSILGENKKKRFCRDRNGECADPGRYDTVGCWACPFGD